MTGHQYDLLRALSHGPRTLRSFTHSGEVAATRTAPYIFETNMAKLVAAGYVSVTGPMHFITPAGRAQIDLSMPTPSVGYPRENFTGTKWQIRPGGEDHLKHASHGERC